MQNKNTSRWLWLLPLIPVFGSLLLEVFGAGPQEILRNNLFDQYQRWKPRTYSEAPVNIIDIDEESLTRVGQWPWPRSRMAELVDRLTQSGVASIGFDVMFAEPDRTSPKAAADLWQLTGKFRADLTALPDHDEILAKSLKRADAVLGFAVERNQEAPHSDSPLKLPVKKANFITLGESQTRWLHPFTSAVPSLLPLEIAAKGNGFSQQFNRRMFRLAGPDRRQSAGVYGKSSHGGLFCDGMVVAMRHQQGAIMGGKVKPFLANENRSPVRHRQQQRPARRLGHGKSPLRHRLGA